MALAIRSLQAEPVYLAGKSGGRYFLGAREFPSWETVLAADESQGTAPFAKALNSLSL